MIATDHAPHSAEEKSRGLEGSAFGIVGLETAFPLLYTKLVRTGIITLDKLVKLMSDSPAKRFGIPTGGIRPFNWDLDNEFTVDSASFVSKGKATPFDGWKLYGTIVSDLAG
jgi:dihydroorotase